MQLLKITSVPIKIKMQTEMAKLQAHQGKPSVSLHTTPGKLSIHSQPIRVRINTYDARKSLGLMTIGDTLKEAAQNGLEAAAEATGRVQRAWQQAVDGAQRRDDRRRGFFTACQRSYDTDGIPALRRSTAQLGGGGRPRPIISRPMSLPIGTREARSWTMSRERLASRLSSIPS